MFLHIQSIADVSAKFHLTVTDIVVWSKVVDCFSLVSPPPSPPHPHTNFNLFISCSYFESSVTAHHPSVEFFH